ncbi:3-deoxy-manno-octulosonate cytidylyltransferase [Pseudohongiella spirulinae]|uniref:3-deoxy-manno-octulosonate cytidylyltransferase n=1 Tax=Pseudohongiella spirulinae TaxID=1249552 RepID=A0A0S2KDU0_9GAMM|nr:3-deoxy-manno-octulosonate cytidylyltransferase [Pseudohongiella spirulinae]ALO46461.1 3-deoxy-manno-octulosonate cytidylyltransferase [Pseudohongiella spirulinae]
MSFTVVIPARYASTRLPGKPLLDIAGKPMVQHVYERACESGASAVYIATDDQRIAAAVQKFGGKVVMTRDDHQSGTDRIQEVAQQLGLDHAEIVVNVQGDEPLIPPAAINQVAERLISHPQAGISSLFHRISNVTEWMNPNAVKVVTDASDYALYFSRAPIPWQDTDQIHGKRHIGIYAYRVDTLNKFVQWPRSLLEVSERLEQLRAMHHDVRIIMDEAVEMIPAGVDTPEDLEAVRRFLSDSEM